MILGVLGGTIFLGTGLALANHADKEYKEFVSPSANEQFEEVKEETVKDILDEAKGGRKVMGKLIKGLWKKNKVGAILASLIVGVVALFPLIVFVSSYMLTGSFILSLIITMVIR